LFGIASIEIILYALNRAIILRMFKAEDIGGTMTIHVYGAFFGIACQFFY
jgi:ammonium transporter Rh